MENQKKSDKMIEMVVRFANVKAIVALKNGVMFTLPLSLIGSVFLLLAQIPYQPFNDWVTSMLGNQWTDPLFQVFNSSMAIMGIVACIGIAYEYVKNEGHEAMPAAIIALVTFLVTISGSVTTDKGETVTGVIPKVWIGGQGMVTAIIIGLIVGYVYSLLLSKKFVINMPDGVPQGVSSQFTALIPGAIIITGAAVTYTFFKFALNTTFIEFIYKVLQSPLQGATDSIGGVLVLAALPPFFWWFGVHGSTIVVGVMTGLLQANGLANQAIIDSGKELTIANGAHIVTQQITDNFMTVGGCGVAIGITISMLIAGKSAQSKALGKLALGPGCFNINEPVVFGFPVVMNPLMFIPFILVPTFAGLGTYLLIRIGFLHPFSAVTVPWTTPPIISGFLLQGWKGALWQIVILIVGTMMYLPFVKKQDNIYLKEEQEAQQIS